MNNKEIFNDNDIIFIYKEQHFNGFAPCLDNNKFLLACCKGNKKNGGMRVNACQKFNEKNDDNQNIWILSIAGKDIVKKNQNLSGNGYSEGDAIYLAKITNTFSCK